MPNNLPFVAQVAVGRREHLNVWGMTIPRLMEPACAITSHVVDLALGHPKRWMRWPAWTGRGNV